MSSAKGISTGGPRAARSKTGTATSEIYRKTLTRRRRVPKTFPVQHLRAVEVLERFSFSRVAGGLGQVIILAQPVYHCSVRGRAQDGCGRYTPGSPGARLQDTHIRADTDRGRGAVLLADNPRDGTWVRGRAQPRTVAVGTDPAPGRARLQDIRGRHRPLGGIPPA